MIRDWTEIETQTAGSILDLLCFAEITNGSTLVLGNPKNSSTFTYPSNPETLRITGVTVSSNASGSLVLLAAYSNPLETGVISSSDSPNRIDIVFSSPPDASSVSTSSVRLVSVTTGIVAGTTVTLVGSIVTVILTTPLATGTYLLLLNGTSLPAITAGTVPLDGNPTQFPTGDGVPGDDFVVPLIVSSASVPHVSPPVPVPKAGAWLSNFIQLIGPAFCSSLRSDDMLTVANAQQWNFRHQTIGEIQELPLPVRNWVFVRPGSKWQMSIPLNLGEQDFSNLELSYLASASTVGSFRERVPVIEFLSPPKGEVELRFSLSRPCAGYVGLRGIDQKGRISLLPMRWISSE